MKNDFPRSAGLSEYLDRKNERIKRAGEYLTKYITTKGLHENRKVILEIGCGHGHWLSSYAAKNTENLFIGIDIITKRIEKCNKKKESLDLTNLFFFKAEAQEFLSALSGKLQVDSTFFMFPDPWPKKRHFKNRLIQQHLLKKLADCSAADSKIFFRSDHAGYFQWTLKHLRCNESWQIMDEEWPHKSASLFQDLFEISYTCSAQIC